MLHQFISSNHDKLVKLCRETAAKRLPRTVSAAAEAHGVPMFLRQLACTLELEQAASGREIAAADVKRNNLELSQAATLHGAALLQLGFTIDQVVHEYGDVCQAVTQLACESGISIDTDEFRTLNRCLDNAIADAVIAFGAGHQTLLDSKSDSLLESLDAFAQEHQRLVDIAVQAYFAVKSGNVGLNGATGALMLHTLNELRALSGRMLPEIRGTVPTRTGSITQH
jgi:hypothetical protein